jgi:hypothetical protein
MNSGSGLESLTGLALLAGCARARRLPPLSRLQWSDRGKPALAGAPAFSIAHAGGYAVCALAPAGIAIGVDIESAGRAQPAALKLVATDAERAGLERGAIDATALWTCKEAVLKAAGAVLADARAVVIDGDIGEFSGVRYFLQRRMLAGGLLLAIATSEPMPAPRARWPNPVRLFAPPARERPGFA